MNLSSLDLNLLLVLHTVLEEKSVAKAAASLHVTSSAVSNALGRLRGLLGDPLLVRHGRGLVPTRKAIELAPRLRAALEELQGALEGSAAPFVPAQTDRMFTLACSDNDQIARVPGIAAAFSARMPRATLRIVSIDQLEATDGLASGQVDAVIAPLEAAGPGLHAAELYRDEAVMVVRRDHPKVGKRLSKQAFNELGHVDIWLSIEGPGLGHRFIEGFFQRHGLRRSVSLIVPGFAAAAMAAATTDLIAGLPRLVAEALAQHLPLRVVELPVAPPPFQMHLLWHERTHADEGARFFRELVLGAMRTSPSTRDEQVGPRSPPAAPPARHPVRATRS
ncbi:LysR family transcriptional regulator [Archangium violaceum]|uniref:LysR family transcriptional regulator n=1 Tax=Archangium violaceum TaxID=83451 RepID=UPI0036DEEA04